MAQPPRDYVKEKGFWDGGAAGHGTNKEASGRPSGFPGRRKTRRVGVNTDVEFPPEEGGGDGSLVLSFWSLKGSER